MTKKQLFKSINKLCEDLQVMYNINCGGCCYVAAVIAEQLEKYRIPYTVYEYICPCHYVIRVSDRYLNRDGFCGEKDIRYWHSYDLYRYYYNNDWNDMYSKKHNSAVKLKIIALFKKYGN